ncbi:substrate-binding domain-containing protein [Chelativorans intermedius]|uniref:Substrate-binding domain-containing protein n=1 Tax=Chelativorans intermedius TaxID=515947 RepID=A0ABV6D2Q4_9HYPH|nr:substrate-binding domain-containing protein [Chelativorans intermedius]MCT8997274.1 substrate-binding domain-containing protein [Chelativorans intermedius]
MNMKTLAEMLGLSQTTVSRALNGHSDVAEATRRRVEEAAVKLGYRPNASAQRLATGRAGAIGLILPANSDRLMNPHFLEFIAGLGTHLIRKEFDIVLIPVELQDEMRAYERIISSRQVDALVLSMPTLADERIPLLTRRGMPFILHGRTRSNVPHAWLDVDNEGAFRRATRHLLQLGHERIALANGPAGYTYTHHREKGYRDALAEYGIAPDPALISNSDLTDMTGYAIADGWLSLKAPPTAILTSAVTMAMGISRAIRSRGLTLGRDVSMVAHDDVFPYLNPQTMIPSLTTTQSSLRAAGSRIGELLLEMLEGRDPGSIGELWPVPLILGDSTGPAPQ